MLEEVRIFLNDIYYLDIPLLKNTLSILLVEGPKQLVSFHKRLEFASIRILYPELVPFLAAETKTFSPLRKPRCTQNSLSFCRS
jgi:hypothetical protein